MRADRLGAYGYAAATTPNLDRLAAVGVRFAQAQAAAPLTLPSHATILTGQLPPRHGMRQNGAPLAGPGLATLAGHLAAAGYRTGAFVGSFVLDRRFGLAEGFEVYDDEVERDVSGTPGLEAERPGREVVDRARAWLAEETGGRPFFAWVHLYDAHAPYEPPEPFATAHPGRPYDGEVAAVDAEVGRLLEQLQTLHLTEQTVIAIAGDHGEALGEHGEPTHGVLLYEASLRVPLILSAPRLLPAGWVVEEPVGLTDLAPTLAALAGHPWPGEREGRDLSRALRARQDPPRSDLYAETLYPTLFGWSDLASLRRGERKAIAAPHPELYDLGRDPSELANLWRKGEGGDLLARLEELHREAAPAVATGSLDEETRAKLESLGYVAPSVTPTGGGEEPVEGAADPKDRIALFRELETARQEMGEGRLDDAVERLAPIVEADPANPVFRGTLAEARRRQGDREEAIALYRQAVADNPADSEGWYNLAVTLQEAGRPGEAIVALTEVLRRAPAKPEAVNALGIALSLTGKLDEARNAFARATELDPENAKAWNNLGNVERDRGRLAEAETAYRRATEIAPDYPDPWNGRGTLAVEAKRPADALPLFDRALALGPQLHEVLLNRAIALELAGDSAAAASGYRAFLAAPAGAEAISFAAQREAAAKLLARLDSRS